MVKKWICYGLYASFILNLFLQWFIQPFDSLVHNFITFLIGFFALVVSIIDSRSIPLKVFLFIFILQLGALFNYFLIGNADIGDFVQPLGYCGIATLVVSNNLNKYFAAVPLGFFILYLLFGIILQINPDTMIKFGSKNNFSNMFIYFLFIWALFLLKNDKKIKYYLLFPLGFFYLLIGIWTASRSTLICSIILFILFIILYLMELPLKKRFIFLGSTLLFCISCFGILWLVRSDIITNLINRLTKYGFSTPRTSIWRDYFGQIFSNPLYFIFGGDLSKIEIVQIYLGNLHNSLLMVHAHYGFIPLVLIMVWIVKIFISSFKKNKIFFSIFIVFMIRILLDWVCFSGLLDIVFYAMILYFFADECNYTLDDLKKKLFTEKDILSISREEQEKYIERLGEPLDDVDRSYYQYLCQMKGMPVIKKIILFFGTLLLMVKDLFSNTKASFLEKKNNILLFIHDETNAPEEYRDNFLYLEDFCGFTWDRNLKEFYCRIHKKYRFHLYFWYKIKKKLMFYNYLIISYQPDNIVTANEYSFTSSIMTNYCEALGIKHINVMHGEKIYYWRDTFFRFSKMYVWNSSYIELFKELKTGTIDFDIYLSKERFVIPSFEKSVDITYYLQEQNKKEMIIIEEKLRKVKNDLKIALRPHPRYTNMGDFKIIFQDYILEDPQDVSIGESLGRTKCAVSLYSTVLLQASVNNIDYLVDDISNEEKFMKLKNLHYTLIHEDNLLSKYINSKVKE